MALIYRSLFEVDDPEFVNNARLLATDWVRWKLDRSDLELEPGPAVVDEDRGLELRCIVGEEDGRRVLRVVVYENRVADGEQVASTFTAFGDGATSWSWMDVERWTTRQDAAAWTPFVPSLVRSVLASSTCSRGPTQFNQSYKLLSDAEVPVLVETVVEPTREVPVVVVTYHRSEDGAAGAESRAHELMRRLGGVANVYVLGQGTVGPFSQRMLERVGPGMDVHSGGVRVYMPGVGSTRDYPRRHRYVPWPKLDGRRSDIAARILAPAAVRRSTEVPPPPVWRDGYRRLIEAAGEEAGDYRELFELASAEALSREHELEAARAERRELEERLEEYETSTAELLASLDDMKRRVDYFRSKLAETGDGSAYVEPEIDSFRPQFCSEVVEEARRRLEFVVVHASVDEHAARLDDHATNESWAQKSWTALEALNAYAIAKRDGFNGDFKTYCSRSAGDVILPTRWVGLHESELVRTNQRFRELRTLPIAEEAVPDGRIYMESHIRIELGGTPCPRIHFYDDTSGATRKIHVGWFGDHLDSFSKS